MQLEREPFLLTNKCGIEFCDSATIDKRWNTFGSKLQVFAKLESRSNKKLKELITAHEAEKTSFLTESQDNLYSGLYVARK